MTTVAWTPSVQDVANYITSRTKDTSGNEVGTFSADTRPNEDQVADKISIAVNDVWSEIGDLPAVVNGDEQTTRLNNAAKNITAIRAAMLVELSYFADQVSTQRSVYPQLREMYSGNPGAPGGLARLVSAVEEYNSDASVGAGNDVMPSFSFPTDCGGMIGWGTRW